MIRFWMVHGRCPCMSSRWKVFRSRSAFPSTWKTPLTVLVLELEVVSDGEHLLTQLLGPRASSEPERLPLLAPSLSPVS